LEGPESQVSLKKPGDFCEASANESREKQGLNSKNPAREEVRRVLETD
jgi:hypothetical protein